MQNNGLLHNMFEVFAPPALTRACSFLVKLSTALLTEFWGYRRGSPTAVQA